MKKLGTRTTKTVIKKTTYETDKRIQIVETTTNGRNKTFTIKEKDGLQPVPLDIGKDFFEKEYNVFFDVRKKQAKIKNIEEFENYPLYYLDFRAEEIFDENKKIITKPYIFSYNGSLKEKIPDDPIYKKLIQKLKEHPFVLELEEEMIPGYNSDFSGQMGIQRARVFIPQEKYEEMYKKAKEMDEEFFLFKNA